VEHKPKSISQLIREKVGPIRGAGDIVAKAAGVFVKEKCAPCEERRKRLNTMFPFGSGSTGSVS